MTCIQRCTAVLLPVLAAAALLTLCLPEDRTADAPAALPSRTVVLDPGHGGADGGAVGRSGTLEKTINLEIALKTASFLRLLGVPVVLTRTDDRSLHSADAKTLRQQKAEDLCRRADITRSQPMPIYLAIHQNFFEDTVTHGAQTFYGAQNPHGQLLAELLQTDLKTALGAENSRKAAPNPHQNYLLEHLQCPAVIVECGFLSHPDEEKRLSNPAYQSKLACSIAVSVLRAANGGLDDITSER